MALYQLSSHGIQLEYIPEELSLTLRMASQTRVWQSETYLQDKQGAKYFLKDTRCESALCESGVSHGVRAVYRHFGDMQVSLHTLLELTHAGELRISFHLEDEPEDGIRAVAYPPAFSFGAPEGHGYSVLPMMQGVVIPAQYDRSIYPERHGCSADGDAFVGLVYERAAYMPMFGQTVDGVGYTAIFDTPFDAQYLLWHAAGGDTLIAPRFIASLGCMRYPRVMLYRFQTDCDYNLMAKTYRKYLKERGRLVTLDMKIVRNPAVERLIGAPIVHDGIAVHISPQSVRYHRDAPQLNDHFTSFETRARQLRELKQKGLENAYLHLDGWGRHGYDNLHPDVFPVHEAAGGAEGMRALADACRELGYVFGIHDQYRDYYYDAPSFDPANAVLLEDGSHPYCREWYGGEQTVLCARLAPDYVRRNYDEFERLGIRIEGSYLDVFSVVAFDECFSPDHPMSREDCFVKRSECMSILEERGIIPSSEETVDAMIPSLALCHHAPYFTEGFQPGELFGIPIPLFNLVWHDCIVIPWGAFGCTGGFGLPLGYDAYGLALINGGTVYCSIEETGEHLPMIQAALAMHRRVARTELVRHELVGGNPKHQKSYFADGTIAEVDFERNLFKIDGCVVE